MAEALGAHLQRADVRPVARLKRAHGQVAHGERRLSALVSADVVGYSQLIAANEIGTVRTLTAYREEIGVLASPHNGRVVDSPGDNILIEFPSATEAVEAAIAIQRVIAARNVALPEGRRLEFRIGVHMGEVLVEGGRIYGNGVNVAARIESVADPGGVSMSETVFTQVVNKVDVASPGEVVEMRR